MIAGQNYDSSGIASQIENLFEQWYLGRTPSDMKLVVLRKVVINRVNHYANHLPLRRRDLFADRFRKEASTRLSEVTLEKQDRGMTCFPHRCQCGGIAEGRRLVFTGLNVRPSA
jgi:hypothetical protein